MAKASGRITALVALGAGAALTALAGAGAPARAQESVESFYKGRSLRVLIGADVGGSYGLYGQLVARHLGKRIPGRPSLALQTMPGAGGNVALNYSYSVAPKDGSLLHLIHAEVLFETLLNPAIKFDAKDFLYVGRIADADAVTLVTRAAQARSLDDARAREITLGATGLANVFALSALMMNRAAGTRFKIIAGYKGASDVMIAMERGELDGAGMSLANALALHGDKLARGDLLPLFSIASRRLKEFPEAPALAEFGGADERTLMEIYVSAGEVGRALALPPGSPQPRLAALRAAFAAMVADPDFLAETDKANIPVSPMSGEALQAYVARVAATPAARLEAARRLHGELAAPKP
jgi:tripartite-type tricarboxylate transporter receptor subunit TctC